ncbi:carbohydrate ABC transporter permease [Isoptericola croceus]|uniref:carbohydrate ABC transporter permease n=1 Tax=Isoptericola croceus TaxID=3031406 RepID=UPI0023F7F58D|nr:carbohydrate ABC transporter permease [Isoptericola croceus]
MTTLTAAPDTPSVDNEAIARRAAAKNRRRVKAVVFHLVALAATIVVLYPAAWMVFASMKPNSDIIGNTQLLPDVWTIEHYVSALSGIGGVSFWTFFGNSMTLAVLSVVGTVLSSTVAAYAFARISFPGRNAMFAVMIGTLLLPFHVTIIPQYILFNNLGMVNTYIPLLAPKFLAAEAFFIFLMIQFIRGIPRSLDEAARIDGCGHGRTFWRIILPLMRPAIVTSSIFTFIWSWNDFLGPLLYLKSPSLYTMPIALRQYVDQTSVSDYGAQMAMAVLALLPVMIFFVIFQRFLINGVATQGIKG